MIYKDDKHARNEKWKLVDVKDGVNGVQRLDP
jgi:hypothetical protein